jgi:hypothetical protein
VCSPGWASIGTRNEGTRTEKRRGRYRQREGEARTDDANEQKQKAIRVSGQLYHRIDFEQMGEPHAESCDASGTLAACGTSLEVVLWACML